MRKQEQKRKGWKGSYTVETSLIMGILIPVLFGILWLAILLYERGILQGDASEGVFLQNMKLGEEREEKKETQKLSLGKAKLSLEFLYSENHVIALGNGMAFMPGAVPGIFQEGILKWKVQEENSWADSTKRIRNICQQIASEKRGESR